MLAFTQSLRQGVVASESAAEKQAMRAFIGILDTMVAGRQEITHGEWRERIAQAHQGGACTTADAETFIAILTTILDNGEAVEGLLETIEEQEEDLIAAQVCMGRAGTCVLVGAWALARVGMLER